MASSLTIEERAAKHAQEQARREDAAQATQDYEAKRLATLQKTERLRAERLARDAAGPPGAAAPATKAGKSTKKPAR